MDQIYLQTKSCYSCGASLERPLPQGINLKIE